MQSDITAAMLSGDALRRDTLRMAESALKLDTNNNGAISLWLASNLRREIQLPTGATDPTSPSTANRSAARVSRFGGGTFRLDAPVPRRSCKIKRENPARPTRIGPQSGSSQIKSTFPAK